MVDIAHSISSAELVDSGLRERVSRGSRPRVQGAVFTDRGAKVDVKYTNAREHFFTAIRSLAASTDSIQARLIEANVNILNVTIDEFDGDRELKIKFAKLLDLLAIDQDDLETVAVENAAHMTDFEAVKVADLICDFYYEIT
ncbi:hypothetical protein [Mesorhizobium sp. M0510]|uniref:hypothetical protein n=1 Tax=unclassified Mesorhizobium TaxID=325217 RepID=UPI00333C1692